MQLVPRQPLRRLQWRLTGLFILASALTTALIYAIMAVLIACLLLFSPDTLAEIETTLREKESEALPYFAGKEPDRHGLTRLLDQAVLVEDAGGGLRFHFMYATIGKFTAAIADANGEILASSPGSAVFPPGKSLTSYVPADERHLIAEARRGILKARWSGPRIVAAGPVRRDGRVIAVAFARSEPLYFGAQTWANFAASLLGSLVWTGGVTAIVGGLVGYAIARSVTRRLLGISRAADAWAGGDLAASAPERPADELGLLARRLNRMAGELQQVIALRNAVAVLEERQRITRDLHDTIKQEAFATAMMVGSARQHLETGDTAAAGRALEEAAALSRQMQTDLSSILTQMRSDAPPALTERLEGITAAWHRRSGLDVRWQARCAADSIAPATGEQVARIVDEAVANAVKHSGGERVTVTLDRQGAAYLVTVADDGVGFDAAAAHPGMGLITMRERAAMLPGGRLEVARAEDGGGGTCVTLRFGEEKA